MAKQQCERCGNDQMFLAWIKVWQRVSIDQHSGEVEDIYNDGSEDPVEGQDFVAFTCAACNHDWDEGGLSWEDLANV